MYIVDILFSASLQKHYIGFTQNLVGRLQRHNGRREQFTRTGVPWQVVHTELFSKKNDALARERQIKNYKNGKVFKELLMHGSSLKK